MKDLLKMLGVAALYALLIYIVDSYFKSGATVSYLEPASGLALAVLLIGGKRYAWGVFLGALLARTMQDSLGEAVVISSCDTLEALCGAWLLTRDVKFDPALRSLRDYLHLILLGGVVGIGIGALTGITALLVFGFFTPASYIHELLHWWMGDMLGIILITPLILSWQKTKNTNEVQTVQLFEPVLLLGLTFFIGQVVFLDWFHDSLGYVAKGYWIFLFITWVAVRLGVRGVTVALLVTAVQALLGAYYEVGFFKHDIAETQLTNYWFYMVTLSMVGMVLATYFAERKLSNEVLRRSETKLRTLYDSTSDAVMLLDEKGFFDCNNATLEMFGCATRAEFCSKHYADLSPPEQPCGTDSMRLAGQKIAIAMESGRHQFEWMHRRADNGNVFPAEVLLNSMELDGRKVLQATVREITERKLAEKEIENLAFYDPLTMLPNRRLLLNRLSQAIALSIRHRRQGALLCMDLDSFKNINDAHGHAVGDLLLVEVANRMQACIREGDTTARLGGDKFVVLLEGLDSDEPVAAAQAETVGEKIRETIGQPYIINGHEYHSTTSIGITLFHGLLKTAEEMLKRADAALYQAKTGGRNTLRFFDPVMQAAVAARVAMESDLRHAVSGEDELLLYYQAQVDSSGRLIGAEALVRWQHLERGIVLPAEFIQIAEESGLILPLGHRVLTTACQQLALWAAQPEMAHLTLAVNISAKQFHLPTFVEEVLALVDKFGIDPAKLKLEITESLMIEKVDDIIAKMNVLKARGISFSMDDFGTGYSSLSYLKRLPLYQLKIDRSFVRDVLTDPNDAAIARMIISLAQSMNLAVIAEGVETEEQREFLELNGCHAFQGYLFGKPVPIAQFEALLKQY